MKVKHQSKRRLIRKAQKGFRGYPVATIAYYGPDNKKATKVAVGIVMREDAEPDYLERWYSDVKDVRFDEDITNQILEFIDSHKVVSLAMVDRIIGCPHEEGIDYPEGESCPQCPHWANRDRWAVLKE